MCCPQGTESHCCLGLDSSLCPPRVPSVTDQLQLTATLSAAASASTLLQPLPRSKHRQPSPAFPSISSSSFDSTPLLVCQRTASPRPLPLCFVCVPFSLLCYLFFLIPLDPAAYGRPCLTYPPITGGKTLAAPVTTPACRQSDSNG